LDFNSRESVHLRDDNHTKGPSDQNYDLKKTPLHSIDIDEDDDIESHTLHDNDPHYVAAGPTDWTGVEVKKLGWRKPQDETATNEVHSYHIDLSAYYTSSQTVSTSNLFVIIITASLLILCTAH